jgi:hypothetical protein
VIYLLMKGEHTRFGLRLMLLVIMAVGLLGVMEAAFGDSEPPLLQQASSIVIMRSLSIPGLATAHYQRFFSHHPNTYYSHVKGVNLLVEYPYDRSLGEEVGFDIYNSNEVDWNANFWATDGLAALGVPGVVLISILCGLLFWVLDSCAQGHNQNFVAVISCYAAANISNISLFTSFVSGGLGFLVILFFFMPTSIEASTTDRKSKPFARWRGPRSRYEGRSEGLPSVQF